MVRAAAILSVIVAVLPLFVYPFVLMANLMGAGAPASGEPAFAFHAARAFFCTSTAYPVVVVPAATVAVVLLVKRRSVAAALAGALPLAYLALVAAIFVVWMKTGG